MAHCASSAWLHPSTLYSLPDPQSDSLPMINALRVACGGCAAMTAKTVLAPLNRLTIILQSQHTPSLVSVPLTLPGGSPQHYSGLISSLRRMVTLEGVTSLWNGNLANIARVIPNYGLRFALTDVARAGIARLHGLDPATTKHSLTFSQLAQASAIAAVVQITATYPVEVVSTRLALSGSAIAPIQYTSMRDCFRTTVRQEGVRALFNGYPITLLSGTPYLIIQMSLFEIFQRRFNSLITTETGSNPKNIQSNNSATPIISPIGVVPKLFAGALASLCAQTFTYPGDVLRRRMQVDGMGSNRKYAYSGIIDAAQKIAQNEGYKAFFKGITVNSIRIIPEGALIFALVDILKKVVHIDQYDTH